mmetsp:Transcript_115230/g.279594  ORF Transcript_115230/g.279594 Transcript_115230/m.279594 type:complete len:209 (+) Transcript_115230:182-808(+)
MNRRNVALELRPLALHIHRVSELPLVEVVHERDGLVCEEDCRDARRAQKRHHQPQERPPVLSLHGVQLQEVRQQALRVQQPEPRQRQAVRQQRRGEAAHRREQRGVHHAVELRPLLLQVIDGFRLQAARLKAGHDEDDREEDAEEGEGATKDVLNDDCNLEDKRQTADNRGKVQECGDSGEGYRTLGDPAPVGSTNHHRQSKRQEPPQ